MTGPREPSLRERFQWIDEEIDAQITRHIRVEAARREAHTEMGKQIIALAFGSLTLTMAGAFSLVGKVVHLRVAFLLPLAWLCLIAAMMLGVYRISWLAIAKAMPEALEQARIQLRALAAESPPSGLAGERATLIIAEAWKQGMDQEKRAIRRLDQSQRVMGWACIVAMIALAAFLSVNVLSS